MLLAKAGFVLGSYIQINKNKNKKSDFNCIAQNNKFHIISQMCDSMCLYRCDTLYP